MKYIFRYTILTTYSHPHNPITPSQLSQALQSLNFNTALYPIPYLQQLSLSCIHQILTKPHLKVLTIIEDTFNPEIDKNIPYFNPKELQIIWQQQKLNLYKVLLKQNCISGSIYQSLNYSIQNIIIKKTPTPHKSNTLITKIHLNYLTNPSNPQINKHLSLTLNKNGVQNMYNSLLQCQSTINQILMSDL